MVLSPIADGDAWPVPDDAYLVFSTPFSVIEESIVALASRLPPCADSALASHDSLRLSRVDPPSVVGP